MPWFCPNCGRPFKHEYQSHSCIKVDIQDHFFNKPEIIINIYEKLVAEVGKIGKMQISPAINAIMLTRESTFLAVKPKRDRIDIEFLLSDEIDNPRINKIIQANQSKFAHFVKLTTPDEVDDELLFWLKMAWDVAK